MSDIPEASVIEIVEKSPGEPAHGVILPNEVRLNGVPLLLADEPIVVHEMQIPSRDLVRVTLTLIAKRVAIHHESPDASRTDGYCCDRCRAEERT